MLTKLAFYRVLIVFFGRDPIGIFSPLSVPPPDGIGYNPLNYMRNPLQLRWFGPGCESYVVSDEYRKDARFEFGHVPSLPPKDTDVF